MPINYDDIPEDRRNAYLANAQAAVEGAETAVAQPKKSKIIEGLKRAVRPLIGYRSGGEFRDTKNVPLTYLNPGAQANAPKVEEAGSTEAPKAGNTEHVGLPAWDPNGVAEGRYTPNDIQDRLALYPDSKLTAEDILNTIDQRQAHGQKPIEPPQPPQTPPHGQA
jgi:hypothetical protein